MTSTIRRVETERTPALTLRGVGKTFGHGTDAVTALRGIDLHVEPGEFVCLLGASGCGKSTLLNLVAHLDAPSTGEVELGTARPSFMFQESALLPWLTAGRNVELQRQRVSLARALASATSTDEPGLLLMDEPFAALDAITRDMLQGELLRVWEATGTTILFVTHDVREAIKLAERVVLLSSRPGTVVGEWRVGDGPITLHDEITGRLRQVITSHAA